jgi:hypothetical protein
MSRGPYWHPWGILMDRKRSASKETIDPTAQMKLGEGIRSRYNLTQPLPDKLDALMTRLGDRDPKNQRPIAMNKKGGRIPSALEDNGALVGRPMFHILIGAMLLVGAFASIYYAILG